jgi:hypothetical protein
VWKWSQRNQSELHEGSVRILALVSEAKVLSFEETGLDLAAKALVSEARDLLELKEVAGVGMQLEGPVEYRDAERMMKELPRKDRLETHPDW